jgi:hypothetical protein
LFQIHQRLKDEGYNVWIDKDKMTGRHLLSQMQNAVDNSSAVLVCMSNSYEQSENCKQGKHKKIMKLQELRPTT